MAYIKGSERERRVRGREPIGCAAARSRETPGEQQGQDEQDGHLVSVHAQAAAGKVATDTCGETSANVGGRGERTRDSSRHVPELG